MRNSNEIFKDLKKTTPGLTAVCSAKKIKKGIQTNIPCVTIFVKKKKKIKDLKPSEIIPKKIDGKVTDVIESEFRSLSGWIPGGDRRAKYRPAPAGVSVGHYLITAGTIAIWIRHSNDLCILSNNHILANQNDANIGDPIYQPGPYDGNGPEDEIAKLTAFHPIDFSGGDNVMDAAIAKVNDINDVDEQIADLTQKVLYSDNAIVDMPVTKSGRTTKVTEGIVTSIDWAGWIGYGGSLSAYFINQIYIGTTNFGGPGDSGSAVLKKNGEEPNTIVGLLFAGNTSGQIIANHIAPILEDLDITVKSLSANFTATPKYGSAPLEVQFTDLSSNPESWAWDFGDTITSEEQNPSHIYQNSGSYTVSLTITYGEQSDTETKTNYIAIEVAPEANFIAKPTSGWTPLEVQFIDLSKNYPLTWTWNFGDGGISIEQNPLHIYQVGKIYTITLIITNDYGSDTETKEDYIKINILLDIPFYYATKDEDECFVKCSQLYISKINKVLYPIKHLNVLRKDLSKISGRK